METFIQQVEKQLKGKTLHGMKSIILKTAEMLPENKHSEFLRIISCENSLTSKNSKNQFDSTSVISHIQGMVDGIEDYNIEAFYYDNWHDDGYEIQSDDGFCDDYIKGYNGVLELIKHELYFEASEAIQLLFLVREEFDNHFDYDGLNFEMFIDEGMLRVDFRKLNAVYGYCQLMGSPENLRATLNSIFDRRNDFGKNQTLIEIIEAQDDLIPNRDKTIEEWIKILYEKQPNEASAYIREASKLTGDFKIMEDYVASVGSKTPTAYIDLIEMRLEHGNLSNGEVINIAKQGLENSPKEEAKRSSLATILADASHDNDDIYAFAITERFYSTMNLNNFLPILAFGVQDVVNTVISNMDKKHSDPRNFNDYYVIHFLNRNYDMVFDKVSADKKALGWSGSLKGALFPYFMGALVGFNKKVNLLPQMLKNNEDESGLIYAQLAENSVEISASQYDEWSKWCANEIGKRVDAIVSGKFTSSYFKAARLLVGFCEVSSRTKDPMGYNLLLEYAAKYPRHSAFKRELRTALGIAKLSGIKI